MDKGESLLDGPCICTLPVLQCTHPHSSDIIEPPPHVHVLRAENVAKIWLSPIEVVYSYGYNQRELNRILKLTEQNKGRLLEDGMTTLVVRTSTTSVAATGVRFADSMIYIALSDGREIGAPLSRFAWLAQASPEQRARWSIEPRGYAVWWDDLDDGIEVCHLLDTRAFA